MAGPKYKQTMRRGAASISTANAGKYDGTGSVALLTGVTGGTEVEEVSFAFQGSNVATSLRFFTNDGTSYFEFEVPIPANTVGVGSVAAVTRKIPVSIYLPNSSTSLKVSMETNDKIDVKSKGWDYV
jgi:hypothetical protein